MSSAVRGQGVADHLPKADAVNVNSTRPRTRGGERRKATSCEWMVRVIKRIVSAEASAQLDAPKIIRGHSTFN